MASPPPFGLSLTGARPKPPAPVSGPRIMTTSAQVYYRKWRPDAFSDLAGQEHTAAALRQAVIQGRVSHSYLFCGTRGSGKTTTARILARAVNCLNPQDGDPCNRCDPCVAINEGRNMDIIELDAASNRGVEEIREIRDKVHFQPAQSKRKIYIIDEAHMLTREASNAFLKTLEEPPAHVIFILCTTEADRLLPTILSRCQRYDFRRLPGQTIYDRLAYITDQEAVAIQPDALRLVARSAGGSMRDALNILEQLAVSADREITLRDVEESLGLARSDSYLTLAQQLLAGDTPGALAAINQAVWEGAEPRQLHKHTLDLLRSILLLSWRAADTLDLPDDTLNALETAAREVDAYRILRAVRIWGEAGPGLRYDAPAALPLEIAAAEICRQDIPAEMPVAAAPAAATPAPSGPAPSRPAPSQPARGGGGSRNGRPPAPRPPAEAPGAPSSRPAPSDPRPARAPAAADSPLGCWPDLLRELSRVTINKYSLGALLRDCRLDNIHFSDDDATLMLPFSNAANYDRMQEELNDPRVHAKMKETIAKHFQRPLAFAVTLAGANGSAAAPSSPGGARPPARAPAQDSPLLRTAIGLGARILEDN